MPRRGRGPYLWLRPERRDGAGRVTHAAVWIIVDGRYQESTKCARRDLAGAERALQLFIGKKHLGAARRPRDPAEIPIVDVLSLYATEVIPGHARPKEALQRIARLRAFFADGSLADINGELCRAFVRKRRTQSGARGDLTTLRAAINFHRTEGYCDRIVSVVMPDKEMPRERWLTRDEAAALIWHAWRYREIQNGRATGRRSRRHLARFMLVALYTGTRAGAVCGAALERVAGAGYIDLDQGIFYRRPLGTRETKKRRPPVPLPRRLLAHLRRWKRRGQRFCVEWNRQPVRDVDKAFRRNANDLGLTDVTPHTLRHTAATWLMQSGVDLWEAAGYVGLSVDQLERTYGHHHADHLKGARDALDRRPGQPRERTASANTPPILPRNRA